VTDAETIRVRAWAEELRAVHERLWEALEVTREQAVAGDATRAVGADLLLFCHGFCAALAGHHEGEDRTLFPALAAAHPELRETLAYLRQDHSMIAHLLTELQAAVARAAGPDELLQHLDGVGAVMESHFRYEERQLLDVLATLALDADVAEVLGPL